MIIIFEQDTRTKEEIGVYANPFWKFRMFKCDWVAGKMKYSYRFCFGYWSISFYGDRGLREFLEHSQNSNSYWKH